MPFPSHQRRQLRVCLLAILLQTACSSETLDPDKNTAPVNQAGAAHVSTVAATKGGSLGIGGTSAALGGGSSSLIDTLGTGGAALNRGGTLGTGGSPTGGRDSQSASGGNGGIGGTSTATGGRLVTSATTQGGSSGGNRGIGGAATGGSTGGTRATGGMPAGGRAMSGTTSTGGDVTAVGGTSSPGGRASGGSTPGGSATGGANGISPCPGATQTLSVASDGTGQYKTVQSAINAISTSNSKLVQVSVKAGTYDEQVTINKPYVCLTGESATSTIITHTIDTNIVTGGTVLLTGNDFSAANITFENSAPAESAQRVALMAKGLRQQFYNCRFVSYQDTLYNNTGTQYFKDCYIQGNTDYIFGDATAVFDNCTIHSITQGTAVTAPRTPQGTTYGFVFLGGSLTASSATGKGRVHLGRPWGPYAAAAFLNVDLGAHIIAEGWTTMSSNTLEYTRFSEYKSTGAGANTADAARSSRQLSDAQAANYNVKNVLGPWVPGYSQ